MAARFTTTGRSGNAGLTITNTTLSGNEANFGGAIVNDGTSGVGTLSLISATLSGNSAPNGGGILNFSGAVTLGNTILHRGSGANLTNDSGVITSNGYNLCDDNGGGFLTATGDQINTDPILGPLKNNGGPTETHAPLSNSPAIDRGKNIDASTEDQRGNARTVIYNEPSIVPPAGGRSKRYRCSRARAGRVARECGFPEAARCGW